jgi:adenosylmethionine-8-amino-7-oxononanoate aminotransferase
MVTNEHVWYPFYQAQIDGPPIKVSRAEGIYLYDAQGNPIIDVNSSWWVNVHGHGRREIQEAIYKQFQCIDHVIFSGVSHQPAEELAEKVVNLLGEPFNKVFFSDNGSTAVEVALKMAIQYFYNQDIPKTKFVALEGSYHGDTFGAMAVCQRGYFNKPFEPYFFDVEFLPFPDEAHWDTCIKMAKDLASNGDVVAFLAEPLVQGSAGMRIYDSYKLDSLVRVFRNSGALIIFDEIMTGWGRLGSYFAMNQCHEKPDILCLSKGLTGGVLPLGLTVATQEIYEVFDQADKAKALLHGHSFTGNPLSCAAALASIEIFSHPDTWKNIERISKKMQSFTEELIRVNLYHHPRAIGTIFAVDILPDHGYFAEVRKKIYEYFLQHGVLCRPLGATVFFNPPYIITNEELDRCFELLLGLKRELEL